MIFFPPNVVLVTIDCLRADVVGCYGGSAATPNIDSIAKQGIVFQHAFAQGYFTKPTFASIFSGTYPWQFGGAQNFGASRPSFVDVLRNNEYTTIGVNSNPWLSSYFGYQRGYSRYLDLSTDRPVAHSLPVVAINNLLGFIGAGLAYPPYPSAESITDVALDMLSTAEAPVFLWLHYMDAHWPYNLRSPQLYGPWDKHNWVYNARLAHRSREMPSQVTPKEQRALRSKYLSAIEYIDHQLGRLIGHIGPGTAMILTSDHGEAFGEHGKYFHQPALHAENVHIPLIIRIPNDPRGRREDKLVRQIDIAPTVLDLANLHANDLFEGISILGSGQDDCLPSDLEAISLIDFVDEPRRWISLRKQGWTAIALYQRDRGNNEQAFLYNYINDPSEKTNLADQYAIVLKDMLDHAQSWLAITNVAASQALITEDMDAEMIERLRSLGYLD